MKQITLIFMCLFLSIFLGYGSLNAQCPTITFGTATATNGTVGTAYSLNAGATTTSGTLSYALSSASPALPAGLLLDTVTGIISGTPTISVPSRTYTIIASTNAGACTNSRAYTFLVFCSTITFVGTPTATAGLVGTPYSLNASATITFGTLAYSVTPTLPLGLSINGTTGIISGTPTTATPSATYTVAISSGVCLALKTYIFAVTCATTPTFAVTTAPVGTAGTPYSLNAAASVAVSYTVAPALPAGLSLNATTGLISGTPLNQVSSTVYTVTAVQSAVGCNASQDYTILINPNPAVTAIANVLENEISVFPNPSKSNFFVNFEKAKQGIYEVILFDIYGRELYKQKINNISNILEINTINYPVGMYLLHILHNKEKVSLKLMKE